MNGHRNPTLHGVNESRVASRRSRAGATRRRADARADGEATVAVIEDGSHRCAGSDDRAGEPRVGERNETKRIIHRVDLGGQSIGGVGR